MHINHLPTRSFNNYVVLFLPYFDYYLPYLHVDIFYLEPGHKNVHFLTTYPPHLVYVVIQLSSTKRSGIEEES